MSKDTGLGMDAFFSKSGKRAQTLPEQASPNPMVRTTITLTLEDADRLELLRMHLRHHQGRSLTYGDVVGMALRRLAESDSIPKPFSRTQT